MTAVRSGPPASRGNYPFPISRGVVWCWRVRGKGAEQPGFGMVQRCSSPGSFPGFAPRPSRGSTGVRTVGNFGNIFPKLPGLAFGLLLR